jgi:hypothetical protein
VDVHGIARARIVLRGGEVCRLSRAAIRQQVSGPGLLLRRRREAEAPLFGVEQQRAARADREHARPGGDQRGNAKRRRDDRDVRGRATARSADARQPCAFQADQLRGQQFVGEQDGAFRQRRLPGIIAALERVQYLGFDVVQVRDAFAQARVVEAGQRARGLLASQAPAVAGAAAAPDVAMRLRVQLRILRKFAVRLEDLALRTVLAGQRRLDARLHRGDRGLQAGLVPVRDRRRAGRPSRRRFCRNAAGPTARPRLAITPRSSPSAGIAASSVEFACGAASPSCDANTRASASIAAAASAPSALACTASPQRAPSAITEIALRALALRPCACRRTCASKGRKAAASCAAGRACNPCSKPTVNSRCRAALQSEASSAPLRDGVCSSISISSSPTCTRCGAKQAQHAAAADEQHRRRQAGRAPRHEVEVEAQQRLATSHAFAGAHQCFKAFAIERDGIDADMQDDLRAPFAAQGQCMAGARDGEHFGGAGRMQDIAGRFDRQAVAGHPLREHRVRHFFQRHRPAGERRFQHQRRHGFT